MSPAQAGTLPVWDAATDTVLMVTAAEAAAGMVRYAKTLGLGSPAAAVVQRAALDLLRGHGDLLAAFNFYAPKEG